MYDGTRIAHGHALERPHGGGLAPPLALPHYHGDTTITPDGAAAATLDIRVLGELRIRRGDRLLSLPASRKSRALLAYLVSTAGPHLRTHLCELLWDGPADPRAALRWSLTKIRPLVDGADAVRLLSEGDRVAFELRGARMDLLEARAALGADPGRVSTEHLRASAHLFAGDFLEGLELPDCHRYREWLVGEREAARRLHIQVLTLLTERLRECPEDALVYARAHVVLEPFAEEAHARVVEVLGRLGRTREALQQYEACRRMLTAQLGAAPSKVLERARAGLMHAGPTGSGLASARPPLALWSAPLAGRTEEGAAIRVALAAARTDHGRGALLFTGSPGIGKTRLLEEAADQIRAVGGVVLVGRAFEAEMVRPYGPWVDALRTLRPEAAPRALWRDLAPLIPELGEAHASVADRGRLFDAVIQLLMALAAGTPVGLLLDDLQWFDDASASLLHAVARSTVGSSLLIVAAARAAELATNPPIATVVRGLRSDGRLREWSLRALDAPATAALVASIGPRLDGARVHAETEGNPLFAIAVARARLAGSDEVVPDTLAALLGDRLDRVDAPARQVLPWAAAFGRTFTLEMLRVVTNLPPAELLGAVETLEQHGVLRPSATPGRPAAYDFTHDLIRETAYRRLPEPRRRFIHRQIACALDEMRVHDEALAGDVSHHALLGDDGERAARAAVSAGERCLRLFAHADADTVAVRALRHTGSLPRDSRVRIEMALLKIAVHADVAGRRAGELATDVTRAILAAQDAGCATVVATGFYLLSFMQHSRGDFSSALESTLRAAEAGRSADPLSRAHALGDTGRCLAQLERELPRAEQLLGEAQSLALAAGVEILDVPWGLGLIRAYYGAYDEATELLTAALGLARREEDRWAECECLAQLVLVELDRGRPDQALQRAEAHGLVASRMGEGSEAPFAAVLKAVAGVMVGAPHADLRLDEAVAALRAIDAKALLSRALTVAASLHLERGDTARAAAWAREAIAGAEAVGRRSEVVIGRIIAARLAAGRGEAADVAAQVAALQDDLTSPHLLAWRARVVLPVLEALKDAAP